MPQFWGPPLALTRRTRGLAVGKGYRQALVVVCPPPGLLSTAPQVFRDAVVWNSVVSLRPDPNPNPNANPHLAGEQQSVATPGREKMG